MDTTARTPILLRLGISLASTGLFVAIYVWAVTTAAGQQFDASTLALGAQLREQWGEPQLARIADLAPWLIVVPAGVVLAIHALRGRGRGKRAVVAAALPVIVYGLATVLHDVALPRPFLGDFGYDINTLPSERLAVAIACCCVLVWLAPRWLPRLVMIPVLAIAAGIVGALEVAAFSSRFADVVACAALAGILAAWWFPSGERLGRASLVFSACTAVALGALGTVLMVRWGGADYHPDAMMPGLVGTACCVAAGVLALSLVLRRQASAAG